MDDEGTQNLELVASMEKDFNKLGITLYNTDGQKSRVHRLLPVYFYDTVTLCGKRRVFIPWIVYKNTVVPKTY